MIVQHDEQQDSDGALLAAVERALGAPVPAQQRAAVLKAARNGQDHWAAARAFALPEGSEPAFVFHPTPEGEHDDG